MSNINRRLLIPLGAGLLALVLWYVVLWSPQSSALSKAKKRTEEAVAKRDNLRSQITRLQESQKDQPLKQAQLETMRVAIPDDPNLAQFILDANDAASKAGIDFLSITPTPPGQASAAAPAAGSAPAGAAVTSIRVAMTISGGYFQVLNFVNLLNNLPRIVVVDGLSLSAVAENTQGAGSAASTVTATGGVTLQVSLQERIFTTSAQSVSGAAGGTGGTGTTGTTTPGATTTTAAGGTTATTTAGATTATTAR